MAPLRKSVAQARFRRTSPSQRYGKHKSLRSSKPESIQRPQERARTETVTWINVQGMGDEATLRRIAELFGIHPLALEDAVNVPQRAKAELYDEHQLVIARAPLLEDGRIEVPQVCFLIGRQHADRKAGGTLEGGQALCVQRQVPQHQRRLQFVAARVHAGHAGRWSPENLLRHHIDAPEHPDL